MSLTTLARMLGIKPHQAEDALHSERAARSVLSRRNLFAASGALALGSAFSFIRAPIELSPFIKGMLDFQAEVMLGSARRLAWVANVPFAVAIGETEESFRDRTRRDLYRLTAEVLNR